MEDRRTPSDQRHSHQNGHKTGCNGQKEEPNQREAHSDRQRVGPGMPVGITADKGLEKRRRHLEHKRNHSDLGKGKSEFLLQQWIDRRNDRLHHIVEQMGGTDHEENRVDRTPAIGLRNG